MKRLITEYPILETITVELSVDYGYDSIASARMIGEGKKLDSQVLADWWAFIGTTENLINSENNLKLIKVVDGKKSNKDNKTPLSKYFYVRLTNDGGDVVGDFIIDFRVSTHDPTPSSIKYRKAHEQQVIDEYSANDESLYAVQVDFVVNAERFKTYEDAIFALTGKIKSIVKKYK